MNKFGSCCILIFFLNCIRVSFGFSATQIDPQFDLNSTYMGISAPLYGVVHSLEIDTDNNRLYVGGLFEIAGSGLATSLAFYDLNTHNWTSIAIFNSSGIETYGLSTIYWHNVTDTLYIAGYFDSVSGVNCSGICAYKNNQWQQVGIGLGGGYVRTITGHPTLNQVFFGGAFNNGINNTAIFESNTLSQIGQGVNSVCAVLVWWNSYLYAGGYFSSSGSVTVGPLVRSLGGIGSWVPLLNGTFNGPIVTLLPTPFGLAFAGLNFPGSKVGGFSYFGVAVWNGSTFSQLGNLNFSSINALAYDDATSSVLAAGEFYFDNSSDTFILAQFGPDRVWKPLVSTISTFWTGRFGSSIAILPNSQGVYLGGNMLIAKLYGQSSTFTCTSNVILLTNSSYNPPSSPSSGWSQVGGGAFGDVRVVAQSNSTIVYGGGFQGIGMASNASYATYSLDNGVTWNAFPNFEGNYFPLVTSVMFEDQNQSLIMAGLGYLGPTNSSIVRYSFATQTYTMIGPINGEIDVIAKNPLNGDIFIGGDFLLNGGIGKVASWNGTRLDKLHNASSANGACNNTVYALAFNSFGVLYVGGAFAGCGPKQGGGLIAVGSIVKYDTTTRIWSSIPGIPFGTSYSILYFTGFMLVGGRFPGFSSIFIYNEVTNTSAAFGNLTGDVWSLSYDPVSQNYYAGGSMIILKNGLPMRGVAYANLTIPVWQPLGHTNDYVLNVKYNPIDESLLIGGFFSKVNEICAFGMASYKNLPGHTVPTPISSTPTPVPTPQPTPPTPPTPLPSPATPPTPLPSPLPSPVPTPIQSAQTTLQTQTIEVSSSSTSLLIPIVVGIVAAVIVLVLILVIIILIVRRRKQKGENQQNSKNQSLELSTTPTPASKEQSPYDNVSKVEKNNQYDIAPTTEPVQYANTPISQKVEYANAPTSKPEQEETVKNRGETARQYANLPKSNKDSEKQYANMPNEKSNDKEGPQSQYANLPKSEKEGEKQHGEENLESKKLRPQSQYANLPKSNKESGKQYANIPNEQEGPQSQYAKLPKSEKEGEKQYVNVPDEQSKARAQSQYSNLPKVSNEQNVEKKPYDSLPPKEHNYDNVSKALENQNQ